jgi:hypothetical protein
LKAARKGLSRLSLPKILKNSGAPNTVFPIALILSCIAKSGIRTDWMTKFLLSQRSTSWTWNYAVRGSKAAERMHYPDDLDDTSCALSALCVSKALTIDGTVMAHFVESLIATEEKPGGPYRTWITSESTSGSESKKWNDIDIAVNANIAYFLALQGVSVPSLTEFIDQAVESRSFPSLYYHDSAIIFYFIARFCSIREDRESPKARQTMQSLSALIRSVSIESSLKAALVTTSLIRLGAKPNNPKIRATLQKILATQKADGSWPESPLYIEESNKNGTTYAQSPELSTAFCVEALLLADTPTSKKLPTKNAHVLWHIRNMFSQFFSHKGTKTSRTSFSNSANSQLARLDKTGITDMVALFPARFAQAIGARIPSAILAKLGCANLLGWVGYTIQDDVMDAGDNRPLIPLSNVCIRESLRLFETTCEKQRTYIRQVFDRIDEANAWEARYRSINTCAQIAVPAHRTISVLAEKSLGHALGPMIIMTKAGYTPNSASFQAMESFFIHYLITRQLNDDAHDWEKDLSEGRVNAAIAPIWSPHKSIVDLKNEFWNTHIDTVSANIFHHAELAMKAYARANVTLDTSYAETLLAPLVRSAQKALSERDKTLDFIKAYENRAFDS